MKVTPLSLDPDATPHGMQGVQFRATRWGVIAAKRPPPYRKKGTPKQQDFRKRFGFAGVMASAPMPLEMITATEMAKGTQQVPRDILTLAALGRYYIPTWPDGTTWRIMHGATKDDPWNIREQALTVEPVQDPAFAVYLSIGDNERLALV